MTARRVLYTSSNGDSWYLSRSRDGHLAVSHEPNAPSGGKPFQVDLGTFLAAGNQGPQHQALRQLISELVEPRGAKGAPARVQAEYDDHE